MAKANRRPKRQNASRHRPQHVVRLERVRVELDPNRSWYAVRVPSTRERDVQRGLQAVGFETFRPVRQEFRPRAGSAVETERRELPGYVFAGAPEATDGRSAIWAWHDAECAAAPALRFLREDGTEGQIPAGERGNALVLEVLGPFAVEHLQQFADCVGERTVAVLWVDGRPEHVFAAGMARMAEKEATWMEAA